VYGGFTIAVMAGSSEVVVVISIGLGVPEFNWELLIEFDVMVKLGTFASIVVSVHSGPIVMGFNNTPATTPPSIEAIRYFARVWRSPGVRRAFLRPNTVLILSEICCSVLPAAASAIVCRDATSAGATTTPAITAAAALPLSEGVAVIKETYWVSILVAVTPAESAIIIEVISRKLVLVAVNTAVGSVVGISSTVVVTVS